jgi:hypothetical protein
MHCWEQVYSSFEAEALGDLEVKGKWTIAVFGIRPQKIAPGCRKMSAPDLRPMPSPWRRVDR